MLHQCELPHVILPKLARDAGLLGCEWNACDRGASQPSLALPVLRSDPVHLPASGYALQPRADTTTSRPVSLVMQDAEVGHCWQPDTHPRAYAGKTSTRVQLGHQRNPDICMDVLQPSPGVLLRLQYHPAAESLLITGVLPA